MLYDLIIIGGGAAGMSAAIYAVRKKIKTLILTDKLGGQTAEAFRIDNYLGIPEITGSELAAKFNEHLKKFEKEGFELIENEEVKKIKQKDKLFEIKTKQNIYSTKTVIIASGRKARRLGVPGDEEFFNKGVTYCATCDVALFENKIVAVVGAGDAGLDAAWQLTKYANKIYILNKNAELKSDDVVLQSKIKTHPKIIIIHQAMVKEIKGTKFVESLIYEGIEGQKEIPLDGVFVEIGSVPSSHFAKNLVKLNERGEIIINHKNNSASEPGIFAAGDVSDILEKQIIIAASEGAKAALSAYNYLKSHSA